MKATKIFGLLLIGILIVFYSCEKETDTTTVTPSNNSSATKQDQPIIVGCYDYITQYCEECHDYCDVSGDNCAPCVVVTPASSIEYVNELIGESSGEVADFFSNTNNYKEIFPVLMEPEGASFLSLLTSGDYIISEVINTKDKNRSVYVAENINDQTHFSLVYAIK